VRIVSYNVDCRNAEPASSLDAIAAIDADVALLQEIDAAWEAALEARFAGAYPHRAIRLDARRAGGLAVLSKLPIETEQLIPTSPDGWFPAQRIVIDGMQILHVHLRPALDASGWVTGYMTTPPIRLRQIEEYFAVMTELPAIVVGDFNEEPSGTTVRFLESKGLARVAMIGPRTWHYVRDGAEVLALDIDHVMIDARLTARDGHVVDAGTSDHRPVVVTIASRK
jgi:endonuclease/exonuclease/phosphatase (EEP) superfamily protein YafD